MLLIIIFTCYLLFIPTPEGGVIECHCGNSKATANQTVVRKEGLPTTNQ